MDTEFRGKNALVTGGSRGIGRATALLFAERGANVAIAFEKNVQAAQDLARIVREAGVQCKTFQMSVTDEAAWKNMSSEIVRDWSSLDVVVANAGIWYGVPVEEMTMEQY